jgi:hypothetical protein
VELGTHSGFSYFTFCQAVQAAGLDTRCFAVDTWKGDEHAGPYGEDVFEHVNSYNNKYYSTFSRLVRSTFEEALPHFSDSSIDLLHIDGRHYYEDVKYDFESWRPKLSERAVVLFHDTNVRERGFGVFRFWAELSNKFPSFEFFHGHGLGLLGHGTELPQEIISLCTSGADSAVAIRTAYSRLGHAVQSDHDSDIPQLKFENSEKAANDLRKELESRSSECRVLYDQIAVLGRELESCQAASVRLHNEMQTRNDEAVALTLQQQSKIERLEAEKLHVEAERTNLISELAIAQSQINRLGAERLQVEAEREDLLVERKDLLGQLSARAQALEDAFERLQALYTSSSWKLTRPLRALKRGAACLRRKAAGLLAIGPLEK